jgi:hypothetical protein
MGGIVLIVEIHLTAVAAGQNESCFRQESLRCAIPAPSFLGSELLSTPGWVGIGPYRRDSFDPPLAGQMNPSFLMQEWLCGAAPFLHLLGGLRRASAAVGLRGLAEFDWAKARSPY